MVARPDVPPAVRPPRWWGWCGLAAFALFLAIAAAFRPAHDTAPLVVGVLLACAGGVPLFLAGPRLLLPAAYTAAAGIALLANADPRAVGWFAVCVLAGWCVLAGGTVTGLAFWGAGVVLFGVEWLTQVHDPGWGAWIAGVSFTLLATVLMRHQLVLVERLNEAQADLAERSRAEERTRIARELHDGIAHSLTVSLLHIAGARLAVQHDPQDAARALAEAERLGRQSLAEVRAVMGMPHADGAIPPPLPGIGDLRRLVGEVHDAGVDASLAVDGDVSALPAATGLTVYRIVQEALTNATKHAAGAPVVVRAEVRADSLEVRVDSAGAPGHGSGMGLLSMRERAEAIGGTCTAGPGGSGWLVAASLPLQAREAT